MRLLLSENDFTEVTLVCDDAKQVKAHKFVLSYSYTHIHLLLLVYILGLGLGRAKVSLNVTNVTNEREC